MAKGKGGCGGCLLKLVIAIAVIIVLLVIAVVIVINLTPEQLGIADLDFGGMTLRDLGLADVKIIEMFKLVDGVMNPDVEAIVTNRYNPEVAKPEADKNLAGAVNNGSAEDGGLKYSDILKETVIYEKEYLYTYSDTTLAFLFQEMINETNASGETADNDGISFLQNLNAGVDEVTIKEISAGQFELRIVVSIDISDYKAEIENNVPDIVGRFVKLPDRVYIVSYSSVTADAAGALVTEGKSIRINDMDSVVADAIFAVISKDAADSVETDEDLSDQNAVNDLVGKGFAEVVGNLGRVGTAEANPDTSEVVGSIELGAKGLKAHSLTVITYTEATNPDAETIVDTIPVKLYPVKHFVVAGPVMKAEAIFKPVRVLKPAALLDAQYKLVAISA